ncbi:ADP-dependent (S)-NAD(P)H-hydrate dehydratase [Sulfuriferula plumbiphila]|uniref:ADP-dependent (S)-NAD(P)H-hydrate dehydratase n=1 Tax=Sulfuriferula plumbiphila TaxID=171865 RepID=A0A512L8G5_9PROT|nr:NAD(P)H-hydrate dehydratase [Sulfuriferula plumbiphila]BBP05021.1 ADP-dependent (S)-NAD(P)H-hydrate dehydratase [Sulfuriferula plumbiphila]GEP30767.1 ADP-dependent (S)-NAD(P)H-hydrate dehydratase [Sulfuriferula plumbiphila]
MKPDADPFPNDRLIEKTILGKLPPRPRDSHKGDFGSVGILGGAPGMTGAALLAARAALHMGAGKVYAASLNSSIAIDFMQPEIMLLGPTQLLDTPLTVLAVGPGLGRSEQAGQLLEIALQSPAILVLDADALNLLAESQSLKKLAQNRTRPTLLTPHPGEAARLLGCDTRTIQRDRPAAALQLVEKYCAWVVLKGAGSICAAPDKAWRINATGNPGLSSAGMGDVLTGMVAALLAQGAAPFAALQLAVYLHGAAADALLEQGMGPVGLTASEVTLEARRLLNQRAV